MQNLTLHKAKTRKHFIHHHVPKILFLFILVQSTHCHVYRERSKKLDPFRNVFSFSNQRSVTKKSIKDLSINSPSTDCTATSIANTSNQYNLINKLQKESPSLKSRKKTISEISCTRGGSSSQQYQYGVNVIEKLRVALAGGIAGATGTAVLYPIDTAKTLRQADPARYGSVSGALKELFMGVAGEGNAMGLRKAYSGVIGASLFSIPSSALYFGAYETSKQTLSDWVKRYNKKNQKTSSNQSYISNVPSGRQRLLIHALSAFSGNSLSSFIFVPKEYIKQQMQAYGSGSMSFGNEEHKQLIINQSNNAARKLLSMRSLVKKTLDEKGICGFYSGYGSTLMRNVPSAIMRFAIYEELKLRWLGEDEKAYAGGGISPIFFMSGAFAGAIASGLMTPMDVIKTRISTGTIPPNMGLTKNVQWILQENGWKGLYAGLRARMVFSGAFSAIGFGTFEAAKHFLGANDSPFVYEEKTHNQSKDKGMN